MAINLKIYGWYGWGGGVSSSQLNGVYNSFSEGEKFKSYYSATSVTGATETKLNDCITGK